jgi:hypothetical protein
MTTPQPTEPMDNPSNTPKPLQISPQLLSILINNELKDSIEKLESQVRFIKLSSRIELLVMLLLILLAFFPQ